MDPITIGLALAKFAPTVVGWIAGDDAEKKAAGVVDVAEKLTGKTGMNAVTAIQKNPALALEFEKNTTAHMAEVLRIHAGDRGSARKMQIANKSWVVPVLAVLTVGGFFAMIGFVLTGEVPKDSTITGMVIGAVGSKAEQVYNFFFGSSSGSKQKTAMMQQ